MGSLLRHSPQPGVCSCFKNPSHLPAPASFPRHLSWQTVHPALPSVPSCAARWGHKIRDGRGAGKGVRAPHPSAGRGMDGRGMAPGTALPSLLRARWNSRSGSPSSCTPPPWHDKLGGKVSHLSLFSQRRPTEHKPV